MPLVGYRERLAGWIERLAGRAAPDLIADLDEIIERLRGEHERLDLPPEERPDFNEPDRELAWEIYLELHPGLSLYMDHGDERLAYLSRLVFAPYAEHDEPDEVYELAAEAIAGGGYPAEAAALLENSHAIAVNPMTEADFVLVPRDGPLAGAYVIVSPGGILELPEPESFLALAAQPAT